MALFFLLTLRKIMNFMNWKNRHTPLLLLLITLVATALTGCSTSKFVPEDRYLLDAVQVRTDSKELDAAQFGQYVRQKGNSHWFSLFKIPLGTYSATPRSGSTARCAISARSPSSMTPWRPPGPAPTCVWPCRTWAT